MKYVKCGSHRAREKLTALLGHKPVSYYNLALTYHLYEIPEAMLEDCLNITGVTKGTLKDVTKDGHTFKFMKTW